MMNLFELVSEISAVKYSGMLRNCCRSALGKIFTDSKRRNTLEEVIILKAVRSITYDHLSQKIPSNPDDLGKDFIFGKARLPGEIIHLKKWREKYELLGNYKVLPVQDFIEFIKNFVDPGFNEKSFDLLRGDNNGVPSDINKTKISKENKKVKK